MPIYFFSLSDFRLGQVYFDLVLRSVVTRISGRSIFINKVHVNSKKGFFKRVSEGDFPINLNNLRIGGMVNRVSIDKTGTKGKMGFLFE